VVIEKVFVFYRPEDAEKALEASQEKKFFGSAIKVSSHEGIGMCLVKSGHFLRDI